MAAKTLRDLFIDELKDTYDAEHRITKALPKLIKAASSEALVAGFEGHLKQTLEHIVRLEKVFELFDVTPARKTCKAMVGLLAEGEELMEEFGVPGLRDAALIAAAQKVEHYEMATYGCLRTWAQVMGEDKARHLLQQTLDEEGTTDHKLTELAVKLNTDALSSEENADFEYEDGDEGAMAPARRSSGTTRSTKTPRNR